MLVRQLNYNSDVLYTKRKEMDDDSMVMKLGRFDRMQLLQVASARDTQGFLYPNLHKEKMHCQVGDERMMGTVMATVAHHQTL